MQTDSHRFFQAAAEGNLEALRALHSPDFWLDDHGDFHQSALMLAVHAPANREECCRFLMEVGANPLRRSHVPALGDHFTPSQAAIKIGRPELARVITDTLGTTLPLWRQDAFRVGIGMIRPCYSKADSVTFCPLDAAWPLWIGGDYNGEYNATPDAVLGYIADRYTEDERRNYLDWFLPFIEKLRDGVDFPLVAVLDAIPDRMRRHSVRPYDPTALGLPEPL